MNLAQEFRKILKDEIQNLGIMYQLFVKDGMNKGVGGDNIVFAPNSTNKLDVRSGQLIKSYMPKDPNNIFKLNKSGENYVWEFGSKLPYAAIHNTGGFIKSKGKMHSYFWAKYFETKNPYMKNLALAVKKRGGVKIPKRPFIDEAEKQLDKYQPIFVNKVVEGFQKIFEQVRENI